ncbi:MAG: GMP synthase (glutamine-hydrolyzing), partial [Phaeodactylibacter sp.]|nr:GMP synthase (glutamine-hydrolyzing) [Phaeodactylibacter sp.]
MNDKILIFDFGSQYTQLIARRVRELNVYCEIHPYNAEPELDDSVKGIILSGSPFSVADENALQIDLDRFIGQKPVLGVCYGAQYIANYYGGRVEPSSKREYGKAALTKILEHDDLFIGIQEGAQVWMSHGDTIMQIPDHFELIAGTESIEVAAFRAKDGAYGAPVFG